MDEGAVGRVVNECNYVMRVSMVSAVHNYQNVRWFQNSSTFVFKFDKIIALPKEGCISYLHIGSAVSRL